jgi:hypothetical protein
MKTITKSKYTKGLQCPRLLWYADRKKLPESDLMQKHRYAQGPIFEEYAKKLYSGIELGDLDFNENIEKTKELVEEKKTIFEAGFKVDDFFIRADILEPNGDGWNLYEIKASSDNPKDIKKKWAKYIPDLAFQKYVIEKCGLKIKKCFVLLLNHEFVKQGEINVKELVSKHDVTLQVELVNNVEENAQKYLEVIKEEDEPGINISTNCNKPYECALKPHCWGTLPDNNVLHLTNWRQYWKFFHSGIIDMKDVVNEKLNSKDTIIREGALSCKVVYDKDRIKEFLDGLVFPLFHFDFETFDTAVPLFDKSRPYQKIPFQYSLHIQSEDGELEHFEFLSEGEEDPRIKLLEQLKKEIVRTGSVVVFNKSFEISVLKKLAIDFPKHASWIETVIGRIVDLAVPFQNFHYYCPTQKGSYSIKKVLPAITGKGYDNLEINNGGDASIGYFNNFILEKKGDSKLREHLLKYCKLDTEGMVWIVRELKEIVK